MHCFNICASKAETVDVVDIVDAAPELQGGMDKPGLAGSGT